MPRGMDYFEPDELDSPTSQKTVYEYWAGHKEMVIYCEYKQLLESHACFSRLVVFWGTSPNEQLFNKK